MSTVMGFRLEKYTIRHPEEVLIVHLETNDGDETILIYNGFSSSLTYSTTYDPDIPVIKEDAKITAIDRLASPYDPIKPTYLQIGLTWKEMEVLLANSGI